MEDILYFSYGSNINIQSMKNRCPDATLLGMGYLENHTLAFTSHIKERQRTGADIVFKYGEEVWGLIYKLSANDLKLLDNNKIYPKVYNRKQITISLYTKPNIQKLNYVWIYEVIDKTLLRKEVDKKYINLLCEAAIQNNFPISYITQLQNYLL